MRKRKTHEEYIEELKLKNPTVEVVERYINAATKIEHHCLIHDVYWKSLPGNVLSGKGCHECMKDKNRERFMKSNEEYVNQVKIINPYIEVIDTYINNKTPILHKCLKHNVIWKAYPSNILKGYGCTQCGYEKIGHSHQKSHEEYIQELKQKNIDVSVLENYKGNNVPIQHKCLKHNIVWKIAPNNVLNGHGCLECHKEKIRNQLVKTHEMYVKEVQEKNPNIEVIGTYLNNKTPIEHKCKIHNYTWTTYPSNILNGHGCKYCGYDETSKKLSLTSEEYLERLQYINSNIEMIGKYITINDKIEHRCKSHNYTWKTSPASVLQGCGCKYCKSEKISTKLTKTHEAYVNELKIKNPSIIVMEEYINASTPIRHKCLIDGYEWDATPGNILFGYGCPRCNESKLEKSIRLWLDANNIPYEQNKTFDRCVDKKPLSFDFYLPNFNLCIECQGKQHYEPVQYFGGEERFKIQKYHDDLKKMYCNKNNIELLEISYWENAENKLNNFLLN